MRLYLYVKILIIAFVFVIGPVEAGIYKWTDAQGKVHYGDKPVDQKQAAEITVDMDANTGVTNSSGNDKERELMTQELQDDRKAREKTREDNKIAKQERWQRCKGLKKRLLKHRRANSVYKKDAKGERVYYTQKQRDAKVKAINKGIAKNCR